MKDTYEHLNDGTCGFTEPSLSNFICLNNEGSTRKSWEETKK